MVEQLILVDKVYWCGNAKEVCLYLQQLSKEYCTVKDLIEAKLQ